MTSPAPSDRRLFVRSALLAAGLGTLAMFITALFANAGAAAAQPFVFLLMIASGGVAVTIYTRQVHLGIKTFRGLKLGLLTGFFGALIVVGITSLPLFSAQARAEFRKNISDSLTATANAAPDPEMKTILGNMTQNLNTTSGLATFLIVLLGLVTMMYLVLAGLGGAVGAALFGRGPEAKHPPIPS